MKRELSEPEQSRSKTAIQLTLLAVISIVYYFSFDMLVNWLGDMPRKEYAEFLQGQVSLKIALGTLLIAVIISVFNVQTLRLRIRHYRLTLDFLKKEFDELADSVQSLNRANQSLKHHLYMRSDAPRDVPVGEYPATYGVKIDLKKDSQ